MGVVSVTLRLSEEETEALRRQAQAEGRSMQDLARQAIRDYIERHTQTSQLDQVLSSELPRYSEAMRRLGE